MQNVFDETQQLVELQRHIERKFSKQNIRKIVREDIQTSQVLLDYIFLCKVDLYKWLDEPTYPAKVQSLNELRGLDMEQLIIDVLTVALPISGPIQLTSLCGQTAHLLPYDDYLMCVKRMAEVIVIMAKNDLFDIKLADTRDESVITVLNRFALDEDVAKFVMRAKFLPPMVCKPNILKANNQSAYLEHRASAFSRKARPHNEDFCLDALNLANQVSYSIDMDFMYACEDHLKMSETGNKEQREEQFAIFKRSTLDTAIDLINQGNKFYFSHYRDARGRRYCRGYQVNTQGKSFHKAMLNFADPVEIWPEEELLNFF